MKVSVPETGCIRNITKIVKPRRASQNVLSSANKTTIIGMASAKPIIVFLFAKSASEKMIGSAKEKTSGRKKRSHDPD